MLTSAQIERARRLALILAGIDLTTQHRELLGRHCRRLGLLEGSRLDLLLDAVEAGIPAARQQFVGLVTTKHTGFFRNPRHLDLAARHALHASRLRGHARLWSAGAATGEDPYSMAMALIEVFGCHHPPVSILASDLDAEALATAQHGEYSARALRAVEAHRRATYFSQPSPGRWILAPVVRKNVEFRLINLIDLSWPVEGPFDVVFCLNVLMYLEAAHRYAVLERMASLLAPDGLLFLDPAEHLGGAAQLFSPGPESICYRRRVPFRDYGATKRLI